MASGSGARHSRGVTDVLVVTTAVRMLDRVLGDTPDARPVVSLRLGLVPGVDSLEERLVLPLAAGANADHGSADALDGLPLAGRELDSGDSAVVGVTMMTAEVPEALAKEPRSPFLPSTLVMMVPSGNLLTGRMLPTERDALEPQ